MPSITRICLVRHGETDWNAAKRVQGQIDIGLNAVGIAQAQALRSGLMQQRFEAAYSSDLDRAWSTARIATEGLGIALAPVPELRERHYGVLQGLTADEARLRQPEAHRHHQERSPDCDYETGETLLAFADRVTKGLEQLARRHPRQSVLAFTHGGVLDIVYRVASGRDLSAPRDFPVANAALNWIEYCAGSWAVTDWGDRRHLERALDETVGEV